MFEVPASTTVSIVSMVADNLSSGGVLPIIIFVGAIAIVFFIIESLVDALRRRKE